MSKTFNEIMAQAPKQPQDFEEYLGMYAGEIGGLIEQYIEDGTHADMDRYLYAPLREYGKIGGKRHRPLICFLACQAVGGDPSLATSAAAAIEHFHTAALIHDDIADDAKTRRGVECLHLSEGLGLAINSGDLALSLVNGTVAKDQRLSAEQRVRVITELVDMTCRTIEGQAMDIGWARDERYDLAPEDYLCMATHKTAYYSGGVPLAVGAIIGGAEEAEVEGLRSFGMDTGLAFQIQDDLLNLVGTAEATQKDFRNDITEGKRTLVVVHALKNATDEDRRRLVQILSSKETDPAVLEEAVQIMIRTGSIDYAKDYALQLTDRAKKQLLETLPESNPRTILLTMADWFVSRLA